MVALSVPIVLAVVFVVMQAWGMNFDRITLGALIIALGLLVDDAIIAVEMMVVKIEQGYRPHRGGLGRLVLDRLPDADRHTGHGGGVPAGGTGEVDQRRIRGQHLLGRGHRADRVLVRRGDRDALPRDETAAARQSPARITQAITAVRTGRCGPG